MYRIFYPSEKLLVNSDYERLTSSSEVGNKMMNIAKCIEEAGIFLSASRSYASASKTALDELTKLMCTAEANINSAEECNAELEIRLQKMRVELRPLFQKTFHSDSFYDSRTDESKSTSSSQSVASSIGTYLIPEHVQQSFTEKHVNGISVDVNSDAMKYDEHGGERSIIMHPKHGESKDTPHRTNGSIDSWKTNQQNLAQTLLEFEYFKNYINKRIYMHLNDLNDKIRDEISNLNGCETEVSHVACHEQETGVHLEPSVEKTHSICGKVNEPISQTNQTNNSLLDLSLADRGKHSFQEVNPVGILCLSESKNETLSSNRYIREKCSNIANVSQEAEICHEYSPISDSCIPKSTDADNFLQTGLQLSEEKNADESIRLSKISSLGKTDIYKRSPKQPGRSQNEGTVNAHSSQQHIFHRREKNERPKGLLNTNICVMPPSKSIDVDSRDSAVKKNIELEEISSYQPNTDVAESDDTFFDRNISNSSEQIEVCTSLLANGQKTSEIENTNHLRTIPETNHNVPLKISLCESSGANDASAPNKHLKMMENVEMDDAGHLSENEKNITALKAFSENGSVTSFPRQRRLRRVPHIPRQPFTQPFVSRAKSFIQPSVTKSNFSRKNTMSQICESMNKCLEAEKMGNGKVGDEKSKCNEVLINVRGSPHFSSKANKKERRVKCNPPKRFHLASENVSKRERSSDSCMKYLFPSDKSLPSCSSSNDKFTSTNHTSYSTIHKEALFSPKLNGIQNKLPHVFRRKVTAKKKLRNRILVGNKVSNDDNSNRSRNENFNRLQQDSFQSTTDDSTLSTGSSDNSENFSKNSTFVTHKDHFDPGNNKGKDTNLLPDDKNSHSWSFSDSTELDIALFDSQPECFETSDLLDEVRWENVIDMTCASLSNSVEMAKSERFRDVSKNCLNPSGAANLSCLSLTEIYSQDQISDPIFSSVHSPSERLHHLLEKSQSFELSFMNKRPAIENFIQEPRDSTDKARLDFSRRNPNSRNSRYTFTTPVKCSSTPTPDYCSSSENSA